MGLDIMSEQKATSHLCQVSAATCWDLSCRPAVADQLEWQVCAPWLRDICQTPCIVGSINQDVETWLTFVVFMSWCLIKEEHLEVSSHLPRKQRTNPSWYIKIYWFLRILLFYICLAKIAKCDQTSNLFFVCQSAVACLHLLIAVPLSCFTRTWDKS